MLEDEDEVQIQKTFCCFLNVAKVKSPEYKMFEWQKAFHLRRLCFHTTTCNNAGIDPRRAFFS